MLAPHSTEIRLSEQELSQATHPAWKSADWGPHFITRLSGEEKVAGLDGFVRDALGKKILVNGQVAANLFLREYQKELDSDAADTSNEANSLFRRQLGLASSLSKGEDPLVAYFQALHSPANTVLIGSFAQLSLPQVIMIRPVGISRNSFELEVDPATGQQKTVLKIRNNYTHLQFSVRGPVEDKQVEVPFRASVEYDLLFVPNANPDKPGAYQIRFPIIIRGEDAELCRELITQNILPDSAKKAIQARYESGLRHTRYFESTLNALNPDFTKQDSEGNHVAADPDFAALAAEIIDKKNDRSVRLDLAKQRQFFVDLYQDLSKAMTEFYLYERTAPLEQTKRLQADIAEIIAKKLSSNDYARLPKELKSKAFSALMVLEEAAEGHRQAIETEAKEHKQASDVMEQARFIAIRAADSTKEQYRQSVSKMICDAIRSAPSDSIADKIIRLYEAEVTHPGSILSGLMRDEKHPQANNEIIKAARERLTGEAPGLVGRILDKFRSPALETWEDKALQADIPAGRPNFTSAYNTAGAFRAPASDKPSSGPGPSQ